MWCDETHKKEGFRYCVGELWCLLEEFDGALWFVGSERLHLTEDLEKLLWWKSGERSGDGVGGSDPRSEVLTRGQGRNCA